MVFKGFIDAAYQLNSRWDSQRCLNLFLGADESGVGKSPTALIGTPGTQTFCTLPLSPVRGMLAGGAPLTSGSRCFVVAGSRLWEVGGPAAHDQTGITASSVSPFFAITDASEASPMVITTLWPHGMVDGDLVILTGFSGAWFSANNLWSITRVDDTSFSIALDTTGFGHPLVTRPSYRRPAISVGTDLYAIDRGYVGDDTHPAQLFADGNVIFLVASGYAWVDDGLGTQHVRLSTPLAGLAIYGTDDTKVVSYSIPFTAADVGQYLDITGGAGFTNRGWDSWPYQPAARITAVEENTRADIGSAITDLIIDSTDSRRITSSSQKHFTSLDVGKYLDITAGTGFIAQTVTISKVLQAQTVYVHQYTDLRIDASDDTKITAGPDVDGTTRAFDTIDEGKEITISGVGRKILAEYTDLAIDVTYDTKVSSALRPFTSADVGNWLDIFAGTGWTPKEVQITAVDGSGIATVDSSVGSVGSTDGVAVERTPGGFTLQTVRIVSVDSGTHVATLERSIGLAGSTHGTGTEWTTSSVAVCDRIVGTAGSTSGHATEWFQTGVATVDVALGTTGSTGGTGIQWSYLTALTGAYLDGYFLANPPDQNKAYFSPLIGDNDRNVKLWDPLDYIEAEANPDHLVSIHADHEQLYLAGEQSVEVWRNVGATTNPFQRYADALIQEGSNAVWGFVSLPNSVAWIGGDARGGPGAFRAKGYVAERISTHAIEQAWKSYSTVADAQTYVYYDEGHWFWVISFPTAGKTWVYDATVSDQLQKHCWHERSTGSGRHVSRCHAYVFGRHIVGAFDSGKLYTMSSELYDDDGTPITRQRVSAHVNFQPAGNQLASNENHRSFFSRFELDCDCGDVSADPTFTLDWSNNGGKSYATAYTRTPAVSSADAAPRVYWNRCGSGRDRVWRVTSTASIRHVWMQAYIEMTGGNA